MPAPQLNPGQRGEILTIGQKRTEDGKWRKVTRGQKADRWRGRCYYRGADGVMGELSRFAATKPEAEQAVETAFNEAVGTDTTMSARMPFVAAGRLWLEHVALPASKLSEKSVSDYTATFRRYVDQSASTVRGLTLAEANNPQRLRAYLQTVADRHGDGAAHMTRSVLGGIMRFAVDNGVLSTNALRQVGAVKARESRAPRRRAGERNTTRAFTRAELDNVIEHADELAQHPDLDPRTTRKRLAVADLLAFLAGTGCRISEALNLEWQNVDLDRGRVEIVKAKTQAGRRALTLPEWLAVRLRERAERVGNEGYVFAAPHHVAELANSKRWDQSNCARGLAAVLEGAGHPWATPHSFRRTVATIAGEAGAPLVDIADQLGHSDPSMTARIYLGRDPYGERASVAQYL